MITSLTSHLVVDHSVPQLCCRPAIALALALALSFASHPPSVYKICFRFIIVLPEFRGERYSL
ncbi:hypothetical protein GBA52_009086 [Prunus armeniaca]|nr:hypothetical protein GBA52_009086 [Prunus armeniaca]